MQTKPPPYAPKARRSVIVVDGDQAIRESFAVLLGLNGYAVATYANAGALLSQSPMWEPDCLLVEVDLPDMDGRQLIQRWRDVGYATPVVMMAAHKRQLIELGEPIALLSKPIDELSLMSALGDATSRYVLRLT